MNGRFCPKFIFSYPKVNERFGCQSVDGTKNLLWKVGETAQADRKEFLSANYLMCGGIMCGLSENEAVERWSTRWIYTKC